MNDTSTAYTIIDKEYREPADIAGRLRPERASWVQWEIRQYEDGTTIRWEREAGRWASTSNRGEWRTEGLIERDRLAAELRDVRKTIALFVETTERPGKYPFPPIEGATGPSPHASTWYEYLKREARKAQRVTSCMYPHECPKLDANRKCGYCKAKAEKNS